MTAISRKARNWSRALRLWLVVANKDGNCTHAKNARKLHIEFASDAAFWGEFEATAKVRIDKLALNQFEPRSDVCLTSENHAVLQMWLASRYRRSAFADECKRPAAPPVQRV